MRHTRSESDVSGSCITQHTHTDSWSHTIHTLTAVVAHRLTAVVAWTSIEPLLTAGWTFAAEGGHSAVCGWLRARAVRDCTVVSSRASYSLHCLWHMIMYVCTKLYAISSNSPIAPLSNETHLSSSIDVRKGLCTLARQYVT